MKFSIIFALLLAHLSLGESAYHREQSNRNLRGSGMRMESIGVWVFESLTCAGVRCSDGSDGSTCRSDGGCCPFADAPLDGQCSCGTSRSDANANRIPCKVILDGDAAEDDNNNDVNNDDNNDDNDADSPTSTPTSSETLDDNDDDDDDATLTPSPTQQSKPETSSPPTPTPTTSPTISSTNRPTNRPTIRPTVAPTPQPTVDAPELQALRRLKVGVNTLNGRIDDLSQNPRYEVFDFDDVPAEVVNVGSPRGDDDNSYRYPGDIMRISSVRSCGSQTSETSSTSSSLETTLKLKSKSYSGGYSQETDVALTVPLPGGAEVGAKTTIVTSAAFGKSSTSSDYKSRAEQGETKTFSVETKAILYDVVLQENNINESYLNSRFVNEVLKLEEQKAGDFHRAALDFFDDFGTHWTDRLSMGASRERSAYFDSETSEEIIEEVRTKMSSKGFNILGFNGGSDTASENASYNYNYTDTKIWLTSTKSVGGNPAIKDETEYCASAFLDRNSVPVTHSSLTPIYNLFEKIDGVSDNTLRNKMEAYLSEALYPRDESGEFKKCVWDTNAVCSWNNKQKKPDCEVNCVSMASDNVNRDAEFCKTSEPFGGTCKWDDNASCTWNKCTFSADCSKNCLCDNEDEEGCRTPITYGEPYYVQVVTGNSGIKRWLTNSRGSKGSDSKPRTGSGNYVRTEDGAHTKGENFGAKYKIYPNQYKWAIRSNAGDGKTIDPKTGKLLTKKDPKQDDECIRYGDTIYLQGLHEDNKWLTGGRGKGNNSVFMENLQQTSPSAGKWILRSAGTKPKNKNRSDKDPRHGQCVRRKDHVNFQATNLDNKYLTGARNNGNWDVYTWDYTQASGFELRSSFQENGQTTSEAANPRTLSV